MILTGSIYSAAGVSTISSMLRVTHGAYALRVEIWFDESARGTWWFGMACVVASNTAARVTMGGVTFLEARSVHHTEVVAFCPHFQLPIAIRPQPAVVWLLGTGRAPDLLIDGSRRRGP